MDIEPVLNKPWGRARFMGGGQLMIFEWFETREACEEAIIQRKADLQSPVTQFPIWVPSLDEEFGSAGGRLKGLDNAL